MVFLKVVEPRFSTNFTWVPALPRVKAEACSTLIFTVECRLIWIISSRGLIPALAAGDCGNAETIRIPVGDFSIVAPIPEILPEILSLKAV